MTPDRAALAATRARLARLRDRLAAVAPTRPAPVPREETPTVDTITLTAAGRAYLAAGPRPADRKRQRPHRPHGARVRPVLPPAPRPLAPDRRAA